MNLYKTITTNLIIGAMLLGFSACGDMDKINAGLGVDGEEIERDNYFIKAHIYNGVSSVVPFQEHKYQFQESLMANPFGGYLAPSNTWPAMFTTYNQPSDWQQSPFAEPIKAVIPSYIAVKAMSKDEVHVAMMSLLRVMVMHKLTDTYGPIPYTTIIESGGALQNPYNSQEEVYMTMISELDAAIKAFYDNRNASASIYSPMDDVYKGNLTAWAKLANSYKLRMAMRMSYIKPDLAKKFAEEAVAHEAGLLSTVNDIAQVIVPQKSPRYLISIEWADDRASADIVSYMNGYNDPRREKYFTPSTFTTGTYHGFRSGVLVPDKSNAGRYSSHLVGEKDPIVWMNPAEIAFIRAEGALRGWSMGGTAESFYEEGIRLSFQQYQATGVDAYINNSTSRPQRYTDPLGQFSYTGTTSTITIKWDDNASFETKLERIITQKWIANFMIGHEAWADFRRTGYPLLMPAVNNLSGGTVISSEMARRVPYPAIEYNENRENLQNAIWDMLNGPDQGKTRLWWDAKK